ncbi:MAG: hypothetical protein DI551_05290 [Micavibrio aeruginosavorus]|uniref:Uncharacterized protein n=1 Tax=Micavibrio aeruginosavorus TaxID=349221 RepID=A0A2W5Q4M3_9BACT|nr:MAG: hypothetical protein DI551_05290 [Micavibrio aeruginosavorus]
MQSKKKPLSRKTADINYRLDLVWSAIRKLKNFDSRSLQTASGQPKDVVNRYINLLVKAGILEKSTSPRFFAPVYKLMKDNGIQRPLVNRDGTIASPSSAQRMWIAIKILKVFNYKDVAFSACVTFETAKAYLKGLKNAGYLSVSIPKQQYALVTYRFIPTKDTGFHAPQIIKGNVYDHNTKRYILLKSEVKNG